MANFCELCGNKLGFLSGYYNVSNVKICVKCNSIYEKYQKLILAEKDNQINTEQLISEFRSKFLKTEKTEDIIKSLIMLFASSDNDKENVSELIKLDHITNINNESNTDEQNISPKNFNIGPFYDQDLVYSIEGVRGRHIDIYKDKVVITTKVTLGSLIAHNSTDGEKTIYYSDCIGIQFKQSAFAIGYLQLETASSNGNNSASNFFAENSFTFDTSVITNEKMSEVADYVKSRVDSAKKRYSTTAQFNNNTTSIAEELLKLKQLLDMGVLSQEEFNQQKTKLLNQ